MSLSNESNSLASPQKKIKWYKQVFNVKWLTDTRLKDWLQQDRDNKDYSYRKCCKTTLKNGNKSMLLRHKESERHKRSYQIAKSSSSISQFFAWKNCAEDEQIIKSELLLAGYFAEHHILSPMLTIC